MSKHPYHFENARDHSLVMLPIPLEDMLRGWTDLRKSMIRSQPDAFTRDEWGYLVSFLNEDNLKEPFLRSFGDAAEKSARAPTRLFRPRGLTAIWLPNNVSLLGPLSIILMSLTGNALRIKAGSQGHDLVVPFLDFCRQELKSGPLAHYLEVSVSAEHFDHNDPRHKDMCEKASVRIIFGSDQAAETIHSLPHPLHSIGFSFSDRQSQAWIEPKALTEGALIQLIKVFAVYGQAGCTSPQKVILLGADRKEGLALANALVALWPKVMSEDPAMVTASENLMAYQWATMTGWEGMLCPRNGAVFAVGDFSLPALAGRMVLPIIPATREEASAHLPDTIQTVGHALTHAHDPSWLSLLGSTPVKRFVPLEQMHHFGSVWDGWSFWREGFEEVGIALGKVS